MSRRRLAADVRSAALPDVVDAGTEVVAGSPAARVLELGAVGAVEVGVWELTSGEVRDVEADEVFVVLSGRGQVRFDDGEVIDLRAGVAVRLREGERTHWVVTEPLRKVYVSG